MNLECLGGSLHPTDRSRFSTAEMIVRGNHRYDLSTLVRVLRFVDKELGLLQAKSFASAVLREIRLETMEGRIDALERGETWDPSSSDHENPKYKIEERLHNHQPEDADREWHLVKRNEYRHLWVGILS